MKPGVYYFISLVLCISSVYSYDIRINCRVKLSRKNLRVNLFGFFKPKDSSAINTTSKTPTAGKVADDEKISKLKSSLEKVSNTQKRDWKAEAANAPVKTIIERDLQSKSFNFNKANEFPNLYKGWIKADGDQIAKQMASAVKASIGKEKYIEVLFDPVPNLDEVAFGTAWNKKFRLEVAEELKVPDYATNRGGPATLEWSNVYWASRLVASLKSPKAVALSISGEGTRGQFKPTLPSGMNLITLSEAKKSLNSGDASLLVLLSPCAESHYKDGVALANKLNVPIIALNSPYSFRYDIGAGAPWALSYVMKRIPKGWIFRQFPSSFQAIIEGPNYEVFRASEFATQPSLIAISKVSMDASAQKYGAVGNDRIFQNRL